MAAQEAAWKSLEFNDDTLPRLLVKVRFDRKGGAKAKFGYDIRLTDLSRIWSETLSRQEILARAEDADCSIDPSEGDDQYAILLDKLAAALDHGNGTSLSLRRQPGDDESLLLDLTATLPSPLPELKWTVHLSPQPVAAITNELIEPLFSRTHLLQRKVELLVQELQSKDRIIVKITDRLENSGNDLTTVFPGVSNIKVNRKRSQRGQLASHVKGLGDFDLDHIEKQLAGDQSDLHDFTHAHLNDICMRLPDLSPRPKKTKADQWWKTLSSAPIRQAVASKHDHESLAEDQASSGSDPKSDAREEGFQRQLTPPQSKQKQRSSPGAQQQYGHKSASKPSISIDESSTADDDDDLDKPASQVHRQQLTKSPTPAKDPTPKPSGRKLGTVGGKRKSPSPRAEPSTSPEASPAPKTRAKLGKLGGKASTTSPSSSRPPSPPPATPFKLGRLGGRSKARTETPPPSMTDKNTVDDDVVAAKPKAGKLGTLGGVKGRTGTDSSPEQREEKGAEVAAAVDDSAQRGRQKGTTQSPSPRERSQERADRKRLELKRELEQKAKAPVKKKRKF